MVEFDVGRALLLTYEGAGVAFSVLASLIVFILILRVASRRRNPAATAGAAETPVEAAQGASILEAADDEEAFLTDGFEAASEAEDWKSYGRWEVLLSRRARGRGTE